MHDLNPASKTKEKIGSLRIQIGLLYTVLAFVNIVFFSVMIFENQSDLLVRSFQLQSENLANSLHSELNARPVSLQNEEDTENLLSRIRLFGIQSGNFYSANGLLQSFGTEDLDSESQPDPFSMRSEEKPEEKETKYREKEKIILERIASLEKTNSSSLFSTKYRLDLNEEDFSIQILIPFTAKLPGIQTLYFYSETALSGIQERLSQIYWFMGIATTWGILFHVLFGIFVYNRIFKRLKVLKDTSESMSKGNLQARANWEGKRKDELDLLGISFNAMAETIETKVSTITKLNREINLELEIGKEVQELFLPKKKILTPFRPGIRYIPMREVSGDIYQVFFQKKKGSSSGQEDLIGFFLGDASGHGVSAALITVVISMFLESIWKETQEPGEILEKLGNLMSDRLEASFFATGVFLLFSGSNLRIANAGHTTVLLRQVAGDVKEIPSSGPPLGMGENLKYSVQEFPWQTGDRIFLYSDGLIEAKNDQGENFGFAKVKDWFEEIGIFESNQKAVDKLVDDLAAHSNQWTDDVTLVLLEAGE
jgi:sigma-B regulation protein RsbU (phosphoserine phosphatase)